MADHSELPECRFATQHRWHRAGSDRAGRYPGKSDEGGGNAQSLYQHARHAALRRVPVQRAKHGIDAARR